MSKRKISESDILKPKKKMRKLNSGSFGDVLTDGLVAYKVSRYAFEKDNGIDSEILNEIIYLRKLRGQKFLLSSNSVETKNITNEKVSLKILVPLAVSDLASYIQNHTLPERGANWNLLVSNILNALHYLQQNDVCHLDIKPGNILFFGDHFKLNDFNLSVTTQNLHKGWKHPSMTILYRPPEVIMHNDYHQIFEDWEITIKSDIWSLGCTLYEFITGARLFDIHHNSQLLRLLYFRVTELHSQRDAFSKYQFLKNINDRIYDNVPLISLETYLENAGVAMSAKWNQTVIEMLSLDPEKRPIPLDILKKYHLEVDRPSNKMPLNNWEDFDYVKYFKTVLGSDDEFGFLDKVKFMAKLKYDYMNQYDRWNLWKNLWIEYKKTDRISNSFFLEIFEIMNRYLETCSIIMYKSFAEYQKLFDVVRRLVDKIRRSDDPENNYLCLPKITTGKMELDILRALDYDFSIAPMGEVEIDFDQFFQI